MVAGEVVSSGGDDGRLDGASAAVVSMAKRERRGATGATGSAGGMFQQQGQGHGRGGGGLGLPPVSRRTFLNRYSVLWTVLVFALGSAVWYLDFRFNAAPVGGEQGLGQVHVESLRPALMRYAIIIPGLSVVTYLICTIYFLQKAATEQRIAETEVDQFLVLGRLAASIAHEVRNPLHNIKLLLEEIEMTNTDPGAVMLLKRLDANASRINHAVELVYRLARPGEVRQRLEGNDYTELSELVEEIRTTLPRLERDRLVCINKSGRHSIYGCGDHGSLQTIIENLIRNACLASKENPVYVDLDIDKERSLACITIYNEGQLPADFNFGEMNEHTNTTKQVRGLGLGVLIVRQLARQMNIDLAYKSDDGVVTFIAKVPLHLGLFNRREETEGIEDENENPARIDC